MWSNILLVFFNKKNINEYSKTQLMRDDFLLFNNTYIHRRLNRDFIERILDDLVRLRKIQFKDNVKETFFVYRVSQEDLAESIYKWSREAAKTGKVETIQFLSSNEETEG